MSSPQELSIAEIRKYMLDNGCKVTNHALVKHFKRFLTHPQTQNEARKQFKTYVNILSTIKNENSQKFLILRKKYLTECPSEDVVQRAVAAAANDSAPSSPGGGSIISDSGLASPFRQPPPYKPPPEVGAASPKPYTTPLAPFVCASVHKENVENYRECVNEFAAAVHRIDPARLVPKETTAPLENKPAKVEPTLVEKPITSVSRANSVEEEPGNNKENIPRFSFSSGTSASSGESSTAEKVSSSDADIADNPISVKEATRKFNRMASEEEAKIISPPSKKKADKELVEEKEVIEVTMAHPKSKEWIVAMAKANYQELAKLANEFPELVKLQDPCTGYTALHWAAKHGNEDVIKLIAGTYKANVNARTNGGYTPLHLSMQFGHVNIFELLCNVYKANRDLMDWSGNKPLDYGKRQNTVSDATLSKIKARRKHTVERDLGFLRIGSLNVRVKKTTEAFSNFLGVGNGNSNTLTPINATASLPHQRPHRHHHHPQHHHGGITRNPRPRMTTTNAPLGMKHSGSSSKGNQINCRASIPISNSKFDKLHKSWGSADNITHNGDAKSMMPPPKDVYSVKKRFKSSKRSSVASNATDSPRDSISSSNSNSNLNSGYSSMPTTPNQLRAPIGLCVIDKLADSDSDSAGFDSNWSVSERSSLNSGNSKASRYP